MIHKECNPDHPVVSSVNSHTENISDMLITTFRQYLRKSNHTSKTHKTFSKVRESKRHTTREPSSYVGRYVSIYKHSK